MVLGEFIKQFLCSTILSPWGHCSYIDPIGDIPDKDLRIFILPSRILLVSFLGYLLNRLYKIIKGGEKTKKEKDYFVGLIIIIILIPFVWFVGNLFM